MWTEKPPHHTPDPGEVLAGGLFPKNKVGGSRVGGAPARPMRRRAANSPGKPRRSFVTRCIIDRQVTDVVWTTEERISAAGVCTADQVPQQAHPLVQYSPKGRKSNLELRAYLYKNLSYNPEVHEPNRRAVRLLEELFGYYLEHRQQLGEQAQKRARRDGWHRAICDYLAGMTDRYAIQEHQRVFG